MKKIKKETLNLLIRQSRKYWRTGDTKLLKRKWELGDLLAKQCGLKYDGSLFSNIVDAMASCDNCNDDINYIRRDYYKVFETLGFTIVEEIEEE